MILGKFSPTDLYLFLELSEMLFCGAAEAKKILSEREEDFFASDCNRPVWCHLYELPILEHVSKGVVLLGEGDTIKRLAGSKNQISEALSLLNESDAEIEAWEPTPAEQEELRVSVASVYALSFSLTNSLRSLMIFGHYINELIATVRRGGKGAEKALLTAVRIDPTVIGCKSVITFLSQRTLLGDTKFIGRLSTALLGRLSASESSRYEKVRLVLQVLHETGAKHLSAPDLYQLFVDELKIVEGDELSNSDVGNVENNLRQFAYQFFKKKSVSESS